MVRKKREHGGPTRQKGDEPTSADWRYAVSVIKMIESFAKGSSRATIGRVARLLEREGWATHRSADRLEQLSVSTRPVLPSEHTRTAIVAKVADLYTEEERKTEEEPWHVARAYLARLNDDGLEDPGQLRRQAAILLDASETIDGLLSWYASRRASIKTRDLTNDTIEAIRREWKTKPRETTAQLTAHGHAVTEGALKVARGRTPGLGCRRGNEHPLVYYLPGLRRRRAQAE